MKILMLGWELPPHNSGGLGVACYHMSKALAVSGAEIDFVVPYSAEHPGIDFMNIYGATKIPSMWNSSCGAYTSAGVTELESSESEIEDPKNMRSIQKHYIRYVERLVTTNAPDVIHAHDWLTMEAGVRAKQLTNAPLIVHVHATEFDRCGDGDSGNPLIHEIEYNGLVMADRILAVSNITKNIIINKYGIPADKIEVVHNAIDVSSFNDGYQYDGSTYKYLEDLKKLGHTVVITLTRFTVQKGLTHFIRGAAKAIAKNDKIAFLLAGDGEQRDELVRLSADLGISEKIFFTGFVRGKQWRDAYSVGDIFVMSSVSEPFGLTALEAAHHGNALIITHQSGVGEILDNIMRYDFWDEDVLASQIVDLTTKPKLLDEMQRKIMAEYDKLSWFDVAKKLQCIYNATLEGAKK
jgi:glycosyltransferase involved in cell wall biosynthesis